MLESEYITMENKLFPIKGIKDYIKNWADFKMWWSENVRQNL